MNIPSTKATKPTLAARTRDFIKLSTGTLMKRRKQKTPKWITQRNELVRQQPVPDKALAVLVQETIENSHSNLVWDPPSLSVRPVGRLSTIRDDTPTTEDIKASAKLLKALHEGLVLDVRKKIEDAILAVLPPLVTKHGVELVKQSFHELDDSIVDFVLDLQIAKKQSEMHSLQLNIDKLQKWRQNQQTEPTKSE